MIKELFRCVVFTFSICLAGFLVTYPLLAYECYVYSEVTDRETKFKLPTGCFIKKGERWVTYEEHLREITAKDLGEKDG